MFLIYCTTELELVLASMAIDRGNGPSHFKLFISNKV